MKKLIEITYNTGKTEIVTLSELREQIATRRYNKLKSERLNHPTRTYVDVLDRAVTDQIATQFYSFDIRKFDHNKAIQVFNAGGSQVAKIINV